MPDTLIMYTHRFPQDSAQIKTEAVKFITAPPDIIIIIIFIVCPLYNLSSFLFGFFTVSLMFRRNPGSCRTGLLQH